jgi:hypothetical protein
MLRFVLVHDGTYSSFAKLCANFIAGGPVNEQTFKSGLESFAKERFCRKLLGNITAINLEEICEKGELFSPALEGYNRDTMSVRMIGGKLLEIFENNKELMNKGAKLKEVDLYSEFRVPAKPCMI